MKIVFGLGNPGSNYDKTRHNTGFMTLDAFAKEQGAEFADKPKFYARIAELQVDGEKVLLVKPQTFYNEVGRSYRSLIDFYKVEPADTLIIHDELALPFGTIRSRIGGSDAGNNGIKSINQHGGEGSARLRVGVANEKRSVLGDTDFVLAAYSKVEDDELHKSVLPKVSALIKDFVVGSHSITSHTVIDKTDT